MGQVIQCMHSVCKNTVNGILWDVNTHNSRRDM